MTSILEAALANPVLDAQSTFRALTEALARPGMQYPLRFNRQPPAPLTAELAVLVLTLCDHDTTVWLDAELARSGAVCDWLAFHTGAPVTDAPQHSTFALATRAELMPPIERFRQGTDEYPDRSTTLILAVPALEGGSPLTCSGPGIDASIAIAPQGLPPDFIEQRAANRARFPRGVDLLLVAPGAVMGLPRSTRLEG